jgi:hypothetical protein
MRFLSQLCSRARALCASVCTRGRTFELKFHIVRSWDVGKVIFLLKNDVMHALNTAPHLDPSSYKGDSRTHIGT